jgi:lipoprotein-releasing system ATP-binding protein
MLRLEGVHKSFLSGAERLHILRGVDLGVDKTEVVALMGPSGVGKSTLLHLIAGLDRPDSGLINISGQMVTALKGADMDRFRRRTVGVVYQFHFLLPEFTALENVMMPAVIAGHGATARATAAALIKEVGLEERGSHTPGRLSGGEQQRVAIARALMNTPEILLADEPTGNLDEETAAQVFKLLLDLKERHGLTVLLATHNPSLASACDRTVRLKDGRILA